MFPTYPWPNLVSKLVFRSRAARRMASWADPGSALPVPAMSNAVPWSGEVLINGTLAPVVGRVCMDTIMVDVTDISGAQENTRVVLIGKQGKEKITAQDIADRVGTIPYEVLTSIGQRVKRIYRRF